MFHLFASRIGDSVVLVGVSLSFLFQKLIQLLKVCSVAKSSQKLSLVFKVRFLRRCKFQVVSVTVALKLRLTWFLKSGKGSVCKVSMNFKVKSLGRQLTNNLSRFATLGILGLNQHQCLRHNGLVGW